MIIYAISLMFISNLHAQLNRFNDSAFYSILNNHYLNQIDGFQQNNSIIPNIIFKRNLKMNDPFVKNLTPPVLTYIGKVKHFNLYSAAPDDMYILKPDSTFILNMPVANNN
jgi:hypothetical protein